MHVVVQIKQDKKRLRVFGTTVDSDTYVSLCITSGKSSSTGWKVESFKNVHEFSEYLSILSFVSVMKLLLCLSENWAVCIYLLMVCSLWVCLIMIWMQPIQFMTLSLLWQIVCVCVCKYSMDAYFRTCALRHPACFHVNVRCLHPASLQSDTL